MLRNVKLSLHFERVNMMSSPRKTLIGRPITGGPPATLVALSLFGGAVLSSVLIALIVWFQQPNNVPLFALVVFLCITPVTITLSWVLLVDRNSLKGAVPNPERSIESMWYSKASQDAFHSIMVIGGLGCLVFTVFPLQVSLTLVIAVALLLIQAIFWTSFGLRRFADVRNR